MSNTRGRPPLPDEQKARSNIHFRVTTKRKAAYVRAAQQKGSTLVAWSIAHLDEASGFSEPPRAS